MITNGIVLANLSIKQTTDEAKTSLTGCNRSTKRVTLLFKAIVVLHQGRGWSPGGESGDSRNVQLYLH